MASSLLCSMYDGVKVHLNMVQCTCHQGFGSSHLGIQYTLSIGCVGIFARYMNLAILDPELGLIYTLGTCT